MHWDVTRVALLPGYRLYVELRDGTEGVFDAAPPLDKGALRQLLDAHYFRQGDIVMGAITWPDGQDVEPETLLAELLPVTEEELPAANSSEIQSR